MKAKRRASIYFIPTRVLVLRTKSSFGYPTSWRVEIYYRIVWFSKLASVSSEWNISSQSPTKKHLRNIIYCLLSAWCTVPDRIIMCIDKTTTAIVLPLAHTDTRTKIITYPRDHAYFFFFNNNIIIHVLMRTLNVIIIPLSRNVISHGHVLRTPKCNILALRVHAKY